VKQLHEMLRIMEYREQQPSTTEKPMIRFYLFSDLRSGEEELLQHGHKKRVIVAMRGLLRHEQI
ncbi:hypothetical protein, partial [Escherichia coli]|uniref:hypothetical protein n=1 Tax=Escherichia coli TaxID=562 RepID=UPI00288331B1